MHRPTRRGRPPAGTGPAALLATLALAASGGCGDDGRRPLHRAEGTVLVDGRPAEGVRVTLYPEGGGIDDPTPRATTGPDGTFRLGTLEPDDGAPPGRYAVTLFWPDRPPGPSPPEDRLGGRYSDPAASALEATIPDDPITLAPIEVTGAPDSPAPRAPGRPQTPDFDAATGMDG